MIPDNPSEQCAHARDILMEPQNSGFLPPRLREILVDWLDLETEVLACRTPAEDVVDWVPSVRLARWVMREAGCDSSE